MDYNQSIVVMSSIVETSFYKGKNMYTSPEIEILDLCQEGVLCASNETVLENDGTW